MPLSDSPIDPRFTRRQREPGLDLLRALAILVVVFSRRDLWLRTAKSRSPFLASIAYSVYLSHKLVIHAALQVCADHGIALTSVWAHLLVQLSIYSVGAALFFAVERPFLQLRRRLRD